MIDSVEELLSKETSIAQLRNFLVRLEQGSIKKVAEARIAELKNLGLDLESGDDMSPREKELAKMAAAARAELLPVPECVDRILLGDYTYISDDHKRLIQDLSLIHI